MTYIYEHNNVKVGDFGILKSETLNKGIGMLTKWKERVQIKTMFEDNGQIFISDKPNATQGYYIEEFTKE